MAKREPKMSLELLGRLMERMLTEQREVRDRLMRVERRGAGELTWTRN